MRISALAGDLKDLFFPKGCLSCRTRIPPEDTRDLICASCKVRLRPPTPPCCSRCHFPLGTGHPEGEQCLECAHWPAALSSARTATVLSQVSGAMVHALKYQGWRTLAEDMADLMTPWLPAHPRDQMVVPVPTTSWRRRMRGYNQAALLGEAVAVREAIPLESALVRSGGRTQVHLGSRERSSNVQRAFRLRDEFRSRIRHRRVILVDDVLTTGATAISAARCLEEAGVASVHLLTFARSLPFTGKVAR